MKETTDDGLIPHETIATCKIKHDVDFKFFI